MALHVGSAIVVWWQEHFWCAPVKRAASLFTVIVIVVWSKREDHRWHTEVKRFGCKTWQEFPENFQDYFGRIWRMLAFPHNKWSVARNILMCNCPFSFLLWLLWEFILHSVVSTTPPFPMAAKSVWCKPIWCHLPLVKSSIWKRHTSLSFSNNWLK